MKKKDLIIFILLAIIFIIVGYVWYCLTFGKKNIFDPNKGKSHFDEHKRDLKEELNEIIFQEEEQKRIVNDHEEIKYAIEQKIKWINLIVKVSLFLLYLVFNFSLFFIIYKNDFYPTFERVVGINGGLIAMFSFGSFIIYGERKDILSAMKIFTKREEIYVSQKAVEIEVQKEKLRKIQIKKTEKLKQFIE